MCSLHDDEVLSFVRKHVSSECRGKIQINATTTTTTTNNVLVFAHEGIYHIDANVRSVNIIIDSYQFARY